MAEAETERILGELEKVFAGEVEYDECLMTLDLHNAEARKKFPSLYKALSNKQIDPQQIDSGVASRLAETVEQLRRELHDATTSPAPQNYQPQQPQTPSVQPKEELPIIDYDPWASEGGPAKTSKKDDRFRVRWKPGMPRPGLGEPWTLRGSTHKSRFTVENINFNEDEVAIVTMVNVALLPLN